MGHLDRRLSRRLIAVDDEQASIDELRDDTTGLRSQLGEPRPTAGVRSALARDHEPGEQLPGADLLGVARARRRAPRLAGRPTR